MYLNADIPPIRCWIRSEYLYDLKAHFDELTPVVVFGLSSIPGQAILFHCLTQTGAQIARMPINAFIHKPDAPRLPLDHLELWDSYSYHVSVHPFSWLKSMRCRVFLKEGQTAVGMYLFTIDWAENSVSESAGDIGHKSAHLIQLDNGCYAAQPNNRILWEEPSSININQTTRPDYRTNSHVWHAENGTSKAFNLDSVKTDGQISVLKKT